MWVHIHIFYLEMQDEQVEPLTESQRHAIAQEIAGLFFAFWENKRLDKKLGENEPG